MDLSASLSLTEKGVDEVKRRVYKLSIRKRSVLLLLDKPHTVEHLLHKAFLHHDELMVEIENLVRDGFLTISAGSSTPESRVIAPKAAAPQYSSDPFSALATPLRASTAPAATLANITVDATLFDLDDEIILSEAKFLLVDFCVDSFGTQSQAFVDEISACRSAESLSACLRKIFSAAEVQCTERLPILVEVIKAINETA